MLDSGWIVEKTSKKLNGAVHGANAAEMSDEQRRLLYVALTRARHQCVVWWACTKTGRSAMHQLLGETIGGAPAAASGFEPLVERAGGTIEVTDIGPPSLAARLELGVAEPPELLVSRSTRRLDRTWRAWSFSGMKSAAETAQRAASGASPTHVADAGGPIRGGADEPAEGADAAEQPPPPDPQATAVLPGSFASGLATAPGGTEFGTMVHSILEVCDFTSPTLREDLRAACTQRARFRTFAVDPDALADGLVRAIEAPLGGPLGATRLRDLDRTARLDELAFDMSLGAIRAAQVGAVLLDHLPDDDLLRPWAAQVTAAGFDVPVAGMLTGSIDLVARSDGHRYWLADYKTNQLGIDTAYTAARDGRRDGPPPLRAPGRDLPRRAAPVPALAPAGVPTRGPPRRSGVPLRARHGPGPATRRRARGVLVAAARRCRARPRSVARRRGGGVSGAVASGAMPDRPALLDGEPTAGIDLVERFRAAGVLIDSDVHIARTVARLCGVDDDRVVLAAALAARAPRAGHTCLDLATVAGSVVPDAWLVAAAADEDDEDVVRPLPLPWPELDGWLDAVRESSMVTATPAPLALVGTRLYLERYLVYERAVAEDLVRRAVTPVDPVEVDDEVVAQLLGSEASDQRAAVQVAAASALTVLIGGPGTGKTTTIAALLASLLGADPAPSVRLAAPTGKAAARLNEAFRDAAARLPADLASRLAEVETSTIHRLLGARPGSSRFRHDRERPLGYDVVIVDETSMVSLPVMAKLLDAIRPDARVVLVGDQAQLASVEAGSVLADVAGPEVPPPGAPLASVVCRLRVSRRFPPGSPIDVVASAIRAGDADGVVAALRAGSTEVIEWVDADPSGSVAVERVRAQIEADAVAVSELAAAGDGAAALAGLERTRILCAHRRGEFGVQRWNARIERWLAGSGHPVTGWYPGRPVLVTANDYRLGLYNGDLGVAIAGEAGVEVVFAGSGGELRAFAPVRLEAYETVHAMTIHKSQGSEFDHVVVVLPPAGSRLATRELLYTAVTRARSRVTLVGDEPSLRAAITERINRASGLRDALWGDALRSVAAPVQTVAGARKR